MRKGGEGERKDGKTERGVQADRIGRGRDGERKRERKRKQ